MILGMEEEFFFRPQNHFSQLYSINNKVYIPLVHP